MKQLPLYKIGCSGFYNRHWKKVFYPEELPQSKWFDFYCQHFNTVEINTTFYRFPTPKSLRPWFTKSPDDFTFSVKAPRLITHLKRFNDCERLVNDFYSACEQGLGNKLGCTLFQLPPSISCSEEKLEQVLSYLKPQFQNVIEFRHKSWWRTKKVYDKLAERKIIFCSVSHPTIPETIVANGEVAYIRLHGTPDMFYSDYSHEYLSNLKASIIKKRKIKKAYIYFNNTAGTAGILNALQLVQIVKE